MPVGLAHMILRAILGVWLRYANFQANNHAGSLFGLAVNVFERVCADKNQPHTFSSELQMIV